MTSSAKRFLLVLVAFLGARPTFSSTHACFFLLSALALLLAALGLFAAAPAGAQIIIPDRPRNVQVTPGNAKLTLTWQAPSSWGSGSMLGYEIDWATGDSAPAVGSSDWQEIMPDPAASATSYTFTGTYAAGHGTFHTVANGIKYWFQIRAVSTHPTDSSDIVPGHYVAVSGTPQAPPQSLSVKATPECGSKVANTPVEPTYALVLTPAPPMNVETESRVIANNAPKTEWRTAGSITTSGRSITSNISRLDRLRNAYPGFNGFKYRLTDEPSVTAECFWIFTEDPSMPNNQPPPNTGGGGGPSPPDGDGESSREDEEPSTLCLEEDREILVSFYEMTNGENWHKNEDWNSDEPLGEWHGVETEDGNVVSLSLSDNNLSGDMPTEELLCLKDKELVELALWGNDDLTGEVPEELVLAVERAVLRDIAEMLNINPEWFENYGGPYDFEDWHEGVTTDDDRRVIELDFTGEEITGEIPESVFELRRLGVIETGCTITLEAEAPERVSVMMPDDCAEETVSSGDGGCALGSRGSSMFGLFLVTLLAFVALWRKSARG